MPRPREVEKSKDFFGSMKRLIKNLKTWKVIMIISLVLAMASSVLSLVAPDKLSDFTDEISNGLVPNTKKLELIGNSVSTNFDEEIMRIKVSALMNSDDFSAEDKNALMEVLNTISTKSDEEKMVSLLSLPENVLKFLLSEIVIDNVVISADDQIALLRIMSNIANASQTEMYGMLSELPDSIYGLIKPKMNVNVLKKIAILLAVLYVLSSIFSYVQSYAMTTISNNFAKKLRKNISNKINKLPLRYFDTHEIGDLLSRLTNDVDTIAQNLNNSLATVVSMGTLFLGSILMMFITNWIMAITAILASSIGFIFMFVILGKSQKYFAKSQKALGDLNGYIEEMYSGHNVVKSYNGSELAIEEFEKYNNDLYEAKRKSIFLSGTMGPMMGFIGNLGYVAVCIVGALLVMNNYISFGVIVAFMIYVRLFTNPLNQIAQAMANLQSTAAASERVFEFLDEEEMSDQKEITKSLDKEKVKGEIEFKHVKFGYNSDKIIIKDFNAKVKPGQKIAIVGPTGAGKTTMVNLLMKFYEINDGDILIDGVSTKDLSRENIHELFTMVLQDTWLFEGSVGENIKFNKNNVKEEDIMKVCKVVGVDHFIKTLPGGLDAKVNDSDAISQGQKQLFTIARGMLENAPFLILDEATSNVDTRTEELVQKAMDALTKGKTSFIIAHRLSTIKNADLILVMDEGNIVEQGNHDELIKKDGFYAKLYNSQFEKTKI